MGMHYVASDRISQSSIDFQTIRCCLLTPCSLRLCGCIHIDVIKVRHRPSHLSNQATSPYMPDDFMSCNHSVFEMVPELSTSHCLNSSWISSRSIPVLPNASRSSLISSLPDLSL